MDWLGSYLAENSGTLNALENPQVYYSKRQYVHTFQTDVDTPSSETSNNLSKYSLQLHGLTS